MATNCGYIRIRVRLEINYSFTLKIFCQQHWTTCDRMPKTETCEVLLATLKLVQTRTRVQTLLVVYTINDSYRIYTCLNFYEFER